MIELHQFPPVWGLPNGSPFCMKLETYMRLSRIPFQSVSQMNPRVAPKKKLPFIHDGKVVMGDSGLIINYLQAKHGDRLDGWLAPALQGVSLAFRRMIEENLYLILLYSRWIDEAGWARTRADFFQAIPGAARPVLANLLRLGVRKRLATMGLLTHSPDEIYGFGIENLRAIAGQLGDRPYFMGEQPSSVDAVVYAFLANIICVPVPSPLQDEAARHIAFAAYLKRMADRVGHVLPPLPETPEKAPTPGDHELEL